MVFWANSRIPAFTLYFLSRPGIFVPVGLPLAIVTNFYGIDYSELPVHGGRTHNYTINFMEVKYPFINNCNRKVAVRAGLLTLTSASVFLPKLGLTSPEF